MRPRARRAGRTVLVDHPHGDAEAVQLVGVGDLTRR